MTEPTEGPASNPEKVKRKDLEGRMARRQELGDIASILTTEEGRRFYWRVMVRCGLFKSSFTGNNTTFFNEGERNIGLMLIADLNEAAPQAYLQMLQESMKKGDSNG